MRVNPILLFYLGVLEIIVCWGAASLLRPETKVHTNMLVQDFKFNHSPPFLVLSVSLISWHHFEALFDFFFLFNSSLDHAVFCCAHHFMLPFFFFFGVNYCASQGTEPYMALLIHVILPSVNWCKSHEPLWDNIYWCKTLSVVWFVWVSCNASWCLLKLTINTYYSWVDMIWPRNHDLLPPVTCFVRCHGCFSRSTSPLQLHCWSPRKSQVHSRTMSPLQLHCWSLRKIQAHSRTMCQLQSHVWRMRQSWSAMGSMSFKQVWEPHHECKWCPWLNISNMIVPSDYY